MKSENVRLVVVPVAGAAALAGVLWLSGIPLSSASGSDDGVRLESDGAEATLVVTDLGAGETVSRTISIGNPGTAPTRLSMTEHGEPPAYPGLDLEIEREGVRLYDGPLGAMSDVAADQGWIPAGGTVTYTFTVSLPEDGQDLAGATDAAVTYAWDTGS